MRLLIAAITVAILSSCTPSSEPVAPLASPVCKLFPARGATLSVCADAMVRVTSVADDFSVPPRYEITTDGKTYTAYDPTAFKAPIGLVATFGAVDDCKGCPPVWRIDVRIDARLSTLLAVCRSGPVDPNKCEDMGSPERLGSDFRIAVLHNGTREYLYIYFKNAA